MNGINDTNPTDNRTDRDPKLQSLLQEYRRLSRSRDNETKIRLLRQIIALSPNHDKSFLEVLRNLEMEKIKVLAENAKEAICTQNYDRLEQIETNLTAPEWSVKPPAEVMAKIQRIMTEVRAKRNAERATNLLEKINDAYSSFDVSALETALPEWHRLMTEPDYAPDKDMLRQVQEAQDYLKEEQKKLRQQEQEKQDLQALKKALEHTKPLEEVNRLFLHLTMAGAHIPEEVLSQYQQFKETTEETQRRKKRLKLLLILLCSTVAVAAVIATISTILLIRQEKQWAERLDQSLQHDPCEVTRTLLDELAAASETLRQRPAITELEARLKDREDREATQRKTFQQLAKTIQLELKDYAQNRDSLFSLFARITECIVDENERKDYLDLENEWKIAQAAFTELQNKECTKRSQKGKELLREHLLALNQNQFDLALQYLQKAFTLRSQIITLPDVDEMHRSACLEPMSGLNDLEEQMAKKRKAYQNARNEFEQFQRCKNEKELLDKCTRFLDTFPLDKDAPMVKKLQERLRGAWTASSASKEGIYKRDLKRLTDAQNTFSHAFSQLNAYVQREKQNYKEQPLYCIIFQGPNHSLLDFYFNAQGVKSFKWDQSKWKNIMTCTFNALSDEYGGTREVTISMTPNQNQMILQIDKHLTLKANLLYPETFRQEVALWNYVAPHARIIDMLGNKLDRLSTEGRELEFEKVVAQTVEDLLDHDLINPQLKCAILKTLITPMHQHIPHNDGYQRVKHMLEDIQNKLPPEHNWLRTGNDLTLKTQAMLREDMKALATIKLKSSVQDLFYLKLLTQNIDRAPQPAGFVTLNNGKPVLNALLATASQTGELWMNTGLPPYWKIIGRFAGRQIHLTPGCKEKITAMDLLFTPKDGKASQAIHENMVKMAKQSGVETILWPDNWPTQVP